MKRILTSFLISIVVSPSLADIPPDMPTRKPGLWAITMVQHTGHKTTLEQCIGSGSDGLMQQAGQKLSQQHCSKNTMSKQGEKIIVDSICKFAGTTSTTHVEFTGDYNSNYTGTIHTSYNPPMMGMHEAKQTLEARWLGVCKPGQKPGDVSMPGTGGRGPTHFNMDEIMKKIPR